MLHRYIDTMHKNIPCCAVTRGRVGQVAPTHPPTGTSPSAPATVTALVLCGGEGTRFGGDKVAADLDGRSVLDVLLESLPPEWDVVAVGPRRPTTRAGVVWTREEPPGGGPLAGIAAGVRRVTTPVIVLVGGDMPFAGPTTVGLVRALTSGALRPTEPVRPVQAVGTHDRAGKVNPLLLAAWTEEVRSALPPRSAGVPARRLLDGLRLATLDAAPGADLDVDTQEDLQQARRRLEP